MTTPAEEIRKAVEILRCDHRFPINPPAGSIYGPGCCIRCGVSYRFEKPVADWMVESLAAWLETEAREYEAPPCDDPTGMCNRCSWDPGTIFDALATAAAIRGGDGT